MVKRLFFSAFLAGLCAGCRTAGPDYAGAPEVALPDTFARAAESAGKPHVARWWSQLGDPVLDSLIDRALKANPTLAAAQTRVRQARAALHSEHANSQPKAGTTLMVAHARLPSMGDGGENGSQLPSSLDLYNLGFDASWEIDLFGGRRRAVEAAEASAQSVEASLADMQVSLVAEVAQAYVNFRSDQQRLALADAAVARQQHILELTRRRREAGTASELDLVRLQGQLEATVAQTQSLRADLDVHRDAQAVLLGQAPGTLDAELAQPAPVPLPPATVAVGDPAALLRNRPDIRAAERTLAARTAQIGQAESARFPHLTFMGLIGIGGTRASDLTHLDDFVGLAAPRLSWNLIDFGRGAANIDKANGARDEAEARYRATVLAALRDAEDALSRFRQRRVTVATRARTQALAARAAHLTLERQRAGTATLIDQLDAERTRISTEQDLAVAKAALTGDFIALHKSLGLGWIKAGR
jgi:NodT family efflux transporter outer membrane factor (OMF) lipoprotein